MTLELVLTPGGNLGRGRTRLEVPGTGVGGGGLVEVFPPVELPGRGVDAVVGNLELTALGAFLLSRGRLLTVLWVRPPLELVVVDCEPEFVLGPGGKGPLLLLALDCDELEGSPVAEELPLLGAALSELLPVPSLELLDPPGWS